MKKIPNPGDKIRTKKMMMAGVVDYIKQTPAGTYVYFKVKDGRLMKTHLDNVNIEDQGTGVGESFPHDVDHMPGRVIKMPVNNETTVYFYKEWKKLADRANSEQHNDLLIVSSGPTTEIYQEEDGKIYALWDKQKKKGYVKAKTTEGWMGGLNRSAPAFDVSYEKVLDDTTENKLKNSETDNIDEIFEEVHGRWLLEKELGDVLDQFLESERVDELSIDTLKKYKDAASNLMSMKKRPLRKVSKSLSGYKSAGDKINAKLGDRTGNKPKYGQINTRHQRANENSGDFYEADFADILRSQNKNPSPGQTVDKEYNGWIIRYQLAPKTSGQPIQWMTWHSKKDPSTAKRGSSPSPEKAFQDATAFINSGGDSEKKFVGNYATISFNVHFTRQIVPGGGNFYVKFEDGFLLVSLSPKPGFIRSTPYRGNIENEKYYNAHLGTQEAEEQKLVPNGRYTLGSKDEIDNETWMFDIHYQGTVASTADKLRMREPGFTVASPRESNVREQNQETAKENRWQGDAPAYSKAPKSSTIGSRNVPLSTMIKDTVDTHGLDWAFDYYVNKHGMPARHFEIFAGVEPGYFDKHTDLENPVDKSRAFGEPSSPLKGTVSKPFSQLVSDAIRIKGLDWAKDYFVNKKGVPEWQFNIFAKQKPSGLGVKE